MNDRNRWEDERSERGRDPDRYRDQGGWESSGRRNQAPMQGSRGDQGRHDQSRGGQQGGWHEDDWSEHRRGSGSRQQGWSDQPEQREWRGADRPWGGSGGGETAGFGSSFGAAGAARRDEDRDERMRRGQSQGGQQQGSGQQGYYGPGWTDDDMPHRDSWGSRDNWREPGSQSFAGGYGMISGPAYHRDRGTGYAGSGNREAFGRGYGPDYGRDEGRGLIERAGDAISSWFSGDDSHRRDYRDEDQRGGERRGWSFRGHGPSDYTRSDERIREDANDRLTDDHQVDARRISVTVEHGEITLNGTVPNREAKRRAEDCVEHISGVRHVQNNLRIEDSRLGSMGQTTDQHMGQTGRSPGMMGRSSGSEAGGTAGMTGGTAAGTGTGMAGMTGSTPGTTGTTGTAGGTAGGGDAKGKPTT